MCSSRAQHIRSFLAVAKSSIAKGANVGSFMPDSVVGNRLVPVSMSIAEMKLDAVNISLVTLPHVQTNDGGRCAGAMAGAE
mmetsp:Transcript_10178/g.27166  ORF Transcript_10178/g.27166 Transcript_10178/m.27166 type:complete len:81 (-) Transcript_10178:52-294(-)